MSQKFIKKKQTSPKSLGYGKYYAKAVYNQKHITTRQLADFIQTQASVKRSDCIAVRQGPVPPVHVYCSLIVAYIYNIFNRYRLTRLLLPR